MQRLRTVTSLDVKAVAGHHAMPAALLLSFVHEFIMFFFFFFMQALSSSDPADEPSQLSLWYQAGS